MKSSGLVLKWRLQMNALHTSWCTFFIPIWLKWMFHTKLPYLRLGRYGFSSLCLFTCLNLFSTTHTGNFNQVGFFYLCINYYWVTLNYFLYFLLKKNYIFFSKEGCTIHQYTSMCTRSIMSGLHQSVWPLRTLIHLNTWLVNDYYNW